MTGILYLGDNSTNFRDNRKTLLFDCFQSIDCLLYTSIEAVKNASDVMKDDMQATLTALKHLQRNSFFRTVGNYKGMKMCIRDSLMIGTIPFFSLLPFA